LRALPARPQERSVLRRYKLKLVTTSLELAAVAPDLPRTPAEAINEADAMAPSPLQVEAAARGGGALDEAAGVLAIEARPQADAAAEAAWDRAPSPADVVAGRLAAAASAAAAAAAPLASNLTCAPGPAAAHLLATYEPWKGSLSALRQQRAGLVMYGRVYIIILVTLTSSACLAWHCSTVFLVEL